MSLLYSEILSDFSPIQNKSLSIYYNLQVSMILTWGYHTPTSGPLNLQLVASTWYIPYTDIFIFFKFLFKCHLLSEAFTSNPVLYVNHSTLSLKFPISLPCIIFSTAGLITNILDVVFTSLLYYLSPSLEYKSNKENFPSFFFFAAASSAPRTVPNT